jgi:hypothetical protein
VDESPLPGADTDSERAIRWLIVLMVLCCDPLAIALTAAASARRSSTHPVAETPIIRFGQLTEGNYETDHQG